MERGKSAPVYCPFCDQVDSDELIKIHCLELHPIDYLLLKNLSECNLGPSPSAFACESIKASQKQDRTQFQNPDLPPSIPVLITTPKCRSRQNSATNYSKERSQSTPLSVTKNPTPQRCSHNLLPCLKFPQCQGRLCPLLHPPCPLLPYGKKCLAFNDCAFDHPEYEKTCDTCPDRIHPDHPPPVLRHCPHFKSNKRVKFLGGGCENKDCPRVHGLCPNFACQRDCIYEHMDTVYFCPECILIKNIIEL